MKKVGILLMVLLFGVVCSAQAEIAGSLWSGTGATFGQDAILADVPTTTPNVTFDVNSPLTFDESGNSTVAQWLSTGGAYNVSGTAGALNTQMSTNDTTGTIIELTGVIAVTHGESFSITHDDGMSLYIDGIDVLSSPGPTSATTTTGTYTGATGDYAFALVYCEVDGPPAVLEGDLPGVVAPLPPSALLLGTGLLGLVGLAWRKRQVFDGELK
ncbi:MAG: hypothetical protein ACLP7A_05490 [Desulfobaccales bacterium]